MASNSSSLIEKILEKFNYTCFRVDSELKITVDFVCKLSANEFQPWGSWTKRRYDDFKNCTVSWIVGGAKVTVTIVLLGIQLGEAEGKSSNKCLQLICTGSHPNQKMICENGKNLMSVQWRMVQNVQFCNSYAYKNWLIGIFCHEFFTVSFLNYW